jgi:hypothetical protein
MKKLCLLHVDCSETIQRKDLAFWIQRIHSVSQYCGRNMALRLGVVDFLHLVCNLCQPSRELWVGTCSVGHVMWLVSDIHISDRMCHQFYTAVPLDPYLQAPCYYALSTPYWKVCHHVIIRSPIEIYYILFQTYVGMLISLWLFIFVFSYLHHNEKNFSRMC